MDFPYECVRCGYCCLTTYCPVAKHLFSDCETEMLCPVLTFDGDIACCGLAGIIVPVDDGCCIKARCFRGDTVTDFASLDGGVKRQLAQTLKERIGK